MLICLWGVIGVAAVVVVVAAAAVVVVVAPAAAVVVMVSVGRGKAEGGQGGAVRAFIGYTRLVCVEAQEWG